ncbi:hypothetical protein BASA83_008782 [Batrachochytrium salamandrivorans]|nr:hypothetical protein BASA83_008782 [Batrachochytrium salamandrivorans]
MDTQKKITELFYARPTHAPTLIPTPLEFSDNEFEAAIKASLLGPLDFPFGHNTSPPRMESRNESLHNEPWSPDLFADLAGPSKLLPVAAPTPLSNKQRARVNVRIHNDDGDDDDDDEIFQPSILFRSHEKKKYTIPQPGSTPKTLRRHEDLLNTSTKSLNLPHNAETPTKTASSSQNHTIIRKRLKSENESFKTTLYTAKTAGILSATKSTPDLESPSLPQPRQIISESDDSDAFESQDIHLCRVAGKKISASSHSAQKECHIEETLAGMRTQSNAQTLFENISQDEYFLGPIKSSTKEIPKSEKEGHSKLSQFLRGSVDSHCQITPQSTARHSIRTLPQTAPGIIPSYGLEVNQESGYGYQKSNSRCSHPDIGVGRHSEPSRITRMQSQDVALRALLSMDDDQAGYTTPTKMQETYTTENKHTRHPAKISTNPKQNIQVSTTSPRNNRLSRFVADHQTHIRPSFSRTKSSTVLFEDETQDLPNSVFSCVPTDTDILPDSQLSIVNLEEFEQERRQQIAAESAKTDSLINHQPLNEQRHQSPHEQFSPFNLEGGRNRKRASNSHKQTISERASMMVLPTLRYTIDGIDDADSEMVPTRRLGSIVDPKGDRTLGINVPFKTHIEEIESDDSDDEGVDNEDADVCDIPYDGFVNIQQLKESGKLLGSLGNYLNQFSEKGRRKKSKRVGGAGSNSLHTCNSGSHHELGGPSSNRNGGEDYFFRVGNSSLHESDLLNLGSHSGAELAGRRTAKKVSGSRGQGKWRPRGRGAWRKK